MIATPAPTFAAGQPCLVRIVATITHEDALSGYTVDYMGTRFAVPTSSLIERVESHMALFELRARIECPNGQAAFLVRYERHVLRVHVQQIHEE